MIKFVRFALSVLVACLLLGLTTLVLAGESQPWGHEFGLPRLTLEGNHEAEQVAEGLALPGNFYQASSTTVMTIIGPSTVLANVPYAYTVITSTVNDLPRSGQEFFVTWSFRDGEPPLIGNPGVTYAFVVTEPFTTEMPFTIRAVAFNIDDEPVIDEKQISVKPLPEQVYLPLLMKKFGSDLICSIGVAPSGMPSGADTILFTVEITNATGVADGFWVDLYINPVNVPPQVNETWGENCGTPCLGIAWAISNQPLGASQSRKLLSVRSTEHPDGYDIVHTNWPGSLPPGSYDVYALVDSLSLNRADPNGAVLESDESNNVCMLQDLQVVPATAGATKAKGQNKLPPRSKP